MQQHTRKTKVPEPSSTFKVSAPFENLDKALKTASEKVDAVRSETKAVAAKVEKTVRKAASNVRKQGETIASDPKAFVNTLGEKAQKVRTEVSREAVRLADDISRRVTKAVENVVEKSLHRFNVPTRQELRTLTQKVDALSQKIGGLKKAPRGATVARKRTR